MSTEAQLNLLKAQIQRLEDKLDDMVIEEEEKLRKAFFAGAATTGSNRDWLTYLHTERTS